ncbi:MAG TPA: AMP-binding protein [Anaerolineales bacterium]|nr:AMP-binding protein [Anaerolineales bacterium]
MTFEALHQSTLGELLSIQATRYANQPFLKLGEHRWTYAEAEYQASALAAGFRKLDLQAGDRLAVVLPNVPPYVLTFFAAMKAGLILVPINVRRHSTEVHSRVSKTRPKAVVAFSDPDTYGGTDHLEMVLSLQADLPELEYVIALDSQSSRAICWNELLAYTAALPVPSLGPRSPAAIIHTLGSSGEPRGAVLTHGGLVRNAAGIAACLGCTPDDVFLGTVPFTNTFGLTATILACTVANAQLVCLPKYRPDQALEVIEREGVTVHSGVPTMFAMEINHPEYKPRMTASLRTGIMSGAPCPAELVRRVRKEMGFNLLVAYGLTEASPGVTITRLDDGPVTATETVGRPMDDIQIKAIGPKGETLPPGEEGELCVRGYNVMLEYWQDPDSTAQVLDEDGWLHTGDLAIIDPNGPVRIVGRVDEVINRAGFKIYPGTVEMVLRSHPNVKEAAVVSIPDLVYGQLSCACVVRQNGTDISAQDLLAFAADHLADYALPDRVLFFNVLPRRGSGPVQKDYLRERVRIRGRAWKFGKNVDTDAIIPARHCNTAVPGELAQHCMEDADPEFVEKMSRGDLIVADTNFGCGSSREVAPLTIKAAGVSAVIAKSFARIFFRNSINIGLPILECVEAVDGIQEGDEIEVEPTTGTIRNLTRGETYKAEPFPDFLKRIIDRGGLLAYVEERLAEQNTEEAA